MKVKTKKRDVQLSKRFNKEDIIKWQEHANIATAGNLSLFMDLALNAYCVQISNTINPLQNKPKKQTNL